MPQEIVNQGEITQQIVLSTQEHDETPEINQGETQPQNIIDTSTFTGIEEHTSRSIITRRDNSALVPNQKQTRNQKQPNSNQTIDLSSKNQSVFLKCMIILSVIIILMQIVLIFIVTPTTPKYMQFQDNDIININVDEIQTLQVKKQQLTSIPDSYLSQYFSGKLKVEENGTVFIKRPYLGFKNMIDYLASNRTNNKMDNEYEQNLFDSELKFWKIPLRKQSSQELQLISIFNNAPAQNFYPDSTQSQWKFLQPFDLKNNIDTKLVILDQFGKIDKFENPQIGLWEGQIAMKKAKGIGRATSEFGIYEGEYDQGYPNGFGRMIFRTRNFYEGQFLNGTITGHGKYTIFDTQKQYSGAWKNSELVNSDSKYLKETYKIIEIVSPLMISKEGIQDQYILNKMLSESKLIKNQENEYLFRVDAWRWLIINKDLSLELQEKVLPSFDSSLKIGVLNGSDNSTYVGQIKLTRNQRGLQQTENGPEQTIDQYVSHGFGLQYGQGWSYIYQGEINEGFVQGYGRIQYLNRDTYIGMFKKGKFDGVGRFIFSNQTVIQGLWKSGVLFTSAISGKNDGFNPQVKMIPISIRIRSVFERDLEQAFKSEPFNETTTSGIIDIWKQIGPFQMEYYIRRELTQEVKKDARNLYVGQASVPEIMNVKYGENNFTTIRNVQNYSVSLGLGRSHYSWGMFEGIKSRQYYTDKAPDYSFNGRFIFINGTVFEGILNSNGQTSDVRSHQNFNSTGQLTLNDVLFSIKLDQRIQEETETKLIEYFSLKIDSKLDLPKNLTDTLIKLKPFDIEQMVSQQLIQIQKESATEQKAQNENDMRKDQPGVVSMIDYANSTSYQGQINKTTNKFQGIGRWANASEIYEGQFVNGGYYGTGRRILSDTTVQEGYFLNGNLVAPSLQIFQLQELFDTQIEKNSTLYTGFGEEAELCIYIQQQIEDGNLINKPQNLTRYNQSDIEASNIQENDGPQLDLINITKYNVSDENVSTTWNGQYTLLGKNQSISTGIGIMTTKTFIDNNYVQDYHTIIVKGDLNKYVKTVYNGTSYTGNYPRERDIDDQTAVYGIMQFNDGAIMEGNWTGMQFQGRPQFTKEVELQQDWSNPPHEASQEVQKTWNSLGSLNVKSLFDKKTFDQELLVPYRANFSNQTTDCKCIDNPAIWIGQLTYKVDKDESIVGKTRCLNECSKNSKCQAYDIDTQSNQVDGNYTCRLFAQDCTCDINLIESRWQKGVATISQKYQGDLFHLIVSPNFTYYGMINENFANGLGRATGPWGIYEGNFTKGVPDGFGRIIMNGNKTYTGLFSQFKTKTRVEEVTKWVLNPKQNGYYCTNSNSGDLLYYGNLTLNDCKAKSLEFPNSKLVIQSTNYYYIKNGLQCYIYSDCQRKYYRSSYPNAWYEMEIVNETTFEKTVFADIPVIGRNKSKVEMDLDKLFLSEVKNQQIKSNHMFNITKLMNRRFIQLDDSIEVGWLNQTMVESKAYDNKTQKSNITWNGQVLNSQISGYGRIQGDWGYYDGQYIDEEVQVYGILTFKNGNYYDGNFIDFTFNGEGKLYVLDQIYDGTWERNKLITSENPTDIGFVYNFEIPRNNQFFKQHIKPV